MSEEVTPLSDRSIRVLKRRGEDYLLEVFRPWDCHEQKWTDADTIQLRFEKDDLLIGRDPNLDSELRQWEVLPGIKGVHQGSSEGLVGDCVCWLVDSALLDEIGVHGSIYVLTHTVLSALDSLRSI